MYASGGAVPRITNDGACLQHHQATRPRPQFQPMHAIAEPMQELGFFRAADIVGTPHRKRHGHMASLASGRNGMVCVLPVAASWRRGRRKARIATADCLNNFAMAIADGFDANREIHVTLAEGLGSDVAQRPQMRCQEKEFFSDGSEQGRFLTCLDNLELNAIKTPGILGLEHSATLKRLQGTAAMVAPEVWDSILSPEDCIFLRHGFLSALEEAGCISMEKGWQPRFLLAWDSSGQLLGAVPLYLKRHCQGEFCEDFAPPDWPHLFVGVPFTPHSGRRLIAAAWLGEAGRNRVERLLLKALMELAQLADLTINVAFSTKEERRHFERAGFIQRPAWQAWWTNRQPVQYTDFPEFLSSLKPKKSRAIERQRSDVKSIDGLQLEIIDGSAGDRDLVSPTLMAEVWHCCYKSTQQRHENPVDLSESFFRLLAERFGEYVLLVMARQNGRLVGGSLSFSNGKCICGRYWGFPLEAKSLRHLHFECCYHQLIEHAIARGCHRIEPGNGGNGIYRVQRDRGFDPVMTPSYHFIPDKVRASIIKQISEKPELPPSWALPRKSAFSF